MPIHDWTRVKAGIFHDFHGEWIFSIKHALNHGVLPAGYYAMAEQVTRRRKRRRVPDVLTLERGRPEFATTHGAELESGPNGGIALSDRPPQVQFTATTDSSIYARKRNRIAIRHVSDDKVAALVEIVSPGNKSGRRAVDTFVDKAIHFLRAGIHLLILDVHPPGVADSQGIHGAIWSQIGDEAFELPAGKPLTLAAYSADFEDEDNIMAFVQPAAVGEVLPDMPLFLMPETYVLVPLETTYQAAFSNVPERWREVLTTK